MVHPPELDGERLEETLPVLRWAINAWRVLAWTYFIGFFAF